MQQWDKNILTLKDIHPELYSYLRQSPAWLQLKTLAKSDDELKVLRISIENYKSAVLAGKLYEGIADFIRLDTEGKKVFTREQAKKQTMTLLFGDPKSCKIMYLDAFKTFKSHYPDVAHLFELFKSRPVDDSKATHYEDFAILLQRIESHMILNMITKKFHQTFTNAPLFTIHDCVVTDLEHKEQLAEIINSELTRVIGAPPKVKFDNWTNENVMVELDEDLYRL